MAISETYNCDCMDFMKKYPDKFFDLGVVDPPYKEEISGLNAGINRDFTYTHFRPPSKSYISELFRVSKKQIIWGFNYFIEMLHSSDGFICWYKHQNGHFSECELAWCSEGNGRFFDRPYQKDIGNKIHPTQKPTILYLWLFENYASPGDKILDTHLGSGSFRIAAYKLGFDFWGCELDKDYFEAQEKRFKQAINEPLFQTQPDPSQGSLNF